MMYGNNSRKGRTCCRTIWSSSARGVDRNGWLTLSDSQDYLSLKTVAIRESKEAKLPNSFFSQGKPNSDVACYAGFIGKSVEGKYDKSPDKEDVVAKIVGNFGVWQFWISVLMSLLKLSGCWYQLNIIFMAPPQEFWCVKPPVMYKYSEAEWRSMCSPKHEEFPCLIFDPDILAIESNINRRYIPLVKCKNFTYDTSVFKRTITADWNLVCDRRWMVHVPQCIMMTGVLLGGVIFGIFADKYGRKNFLMLTIVIQAVSSFVASFMLWYWVFLVVWFILALGCGGITIISFVLCMESLGGKWREIIPVLFQIPFGLGNSVMAVLANYLKDWRKLEVALASLSSLYILYWLWIPESPRWLMADGQTEKAVDELYRASNINNKGRTRQQIRSMMPKPKPKPASPSFWDFLIYPGMRQKTILLSLDWLFTGIAFYTFSQYLGGIGGGNIFAMVAITGLISAPGPVFAVFVVLVTGRKTAIWIFQFFTTICFVVVWILPKTTSGESDWPRIVVAGIGFAAMAASVPTLYLYSAELYPTLGRNSGVGGVTMFARFGSMMAPFIVMMDTFMDDLPLIFLAIVSFLQMFLLIPLPETKNQPLPDTIEEAEAFKKYTRRKSRKQYGKKYIPLHTIMISKPAMNPPNNKKPNREETQPVRSSASKSKRKRDKGVNELAAISSTPIVFKFVQEGSQGVPGGFSCSSGRSQARNASNRILCENIKTYPSPNLFIDETNDQVANKLSNISKREVKVYCRKRKTHLPGPPGREILLKPSKHELCNCKESLPSLEVICEPEINNQVVKNQLLNVCKRHKDVMVCCRKRKNHFPGPPGRGILLKPSKHELSNCKESRLSQKIICKPTNAEVRKTSKHVSVCDGNTLKESMSMSAIEQFKDPTRSVITSEYIDNLSSLNSSYNQIPDPTKRVLYEYRQRIQPVRDFNRLNKKIQSSADPATHEMKPFDKETETQLIGTELQSSTYKNSDIPPLLGCEITTCKGYENLLFDKL